MYSKKYYMSAKEEYLHSKRLFHYNDKLSFPRLGELTSKKIYILFKEALMPE